MSTNPCLQLKNIVNSEPFQGKQSTQRIMEDLNLFVDMQDYNKTRTFFVTSICDVRLCEEKKMPFLSQLIGTVTMAPL